jgi:propionyl-CoA carboxylase alpha chain
MITNLLVANRGEIARRVFRTCAQLGIGTVAVYSDADASAPHVGEADTAVRLPGNAPVDTYLRADLLVKAAAEAGADAVHPGYGFLSENAAFARACLDAGLTWVGPPPAAIEAMGSKVAAKRLMGEAGVPVLPELTASADGPGVTEADLPVLVKASAGGGGRGMRIVRSLAALSEAVAGASAEAGAAFGDPTVFCERFLETGRHIEVQVLADTHGTVWALGERECSLQRRHQKVLEESPSPWVSEEMRVRLCHAAVTAARAVGYVGAGTVEFLAAPDGEFYFLEMNTRLQVEHPVTECVTGLDLVALQLAVAEGTPLASVHPDGPPPARGHAIEVRLYAEDPARDWQPQSGTLHRFAVPGVSAEFRVPDGYGLRMDSGVLDNSAVSVHYDPMLAKVIAWAPNRTGAARALAAALRGAQIHGLRTNRDLLVRTLCHPAFLAGEIDTGFFDRHGLATLAEPLAPVEVVRLSALAAALADAAANRSAACVLGKLPAGWRNVPSGPQHKCYRVERGSADSDIEVSYLLTRDGLRTEHLDGVALVSLTPQRVVLEVGGLRRAFQVARYGAELVTVDSALGPVALRRLPRFAEPESTPASGSLVAPMPGTVLRLAVSEGDRVSAGQPVLWLEAMKMEHQVSAPADGTVSGLAVYAGQQVEVGTVLAVVDPVPSETED